jgi:hypothetical protein
VSLELASSTLRNRQVNGSSPIVGSRFSNHFQSGLLLIGPPNCPRTVRVQIRPARAIRMTGSRTSSTSLPRDVLGQAYSRLPDIGLIDNVVSVEDRASLVSSDAHGDALGGAHHCPAPSSSPSARVLRLRNARRLLKVRLVEFPRDRNVGTLIRGAIAVLALPAIVLGSLYIDCTNPVVCRWLGSYTYYVRTLPEYDRWVQGADLSREHDAPKVRFACEALRDQVTRVWHEQIVAHSQLAPGRALDELIRLDTLGARRNGEALHLALCMITEQDELDRASSVLNDAFRSVVPRRRGNDALPAMTRGLFTTVVVTGSVNDLRPVVLQVGTGVAPVPWTVMGLVGQAAGRCFFSWLIGDSVVGTSRPGRRVIPTARRSRRWSPR